MQKLTIGIDASNIRGGGGLTHLVELLRAADFGKHSISNVIVWAGRTTSDRIVTRSEIELRHCSELDGTFVSRLWWQRYRLSRLARREGCDVLLAPGGNFTGDFRPAVVMCRNMLPFELRERRRYRWTLTGLRLAALSRAQLRSFQACEGLIFLTDYASNTVSPLLQGRQNNTVVIPHGVSERFRLRVKDQHDIKNYSFESPLKIIYVSIVDQYKHQWQVAHAIVALRNQGYPVELTVVGPTYPPAMRKLRKAMDNAAGAVNYHGQADHAALHELYATADICVFASSCENMPNILLEKMASGRPIACSDRGPMREVLQGCGVYFNPEDSGSIANALRRLIDQPGLRKELAKAAANRVQQFTWSTCADQTLQFLRDTSRSAAAHSGVPS